MKLTTLTSAIVLASTMTMATFGIADEKKTLTVFVKKGTDSTTTVDLKTNGNASSFTMPDLEDGQSETILTESGKQFIVTRDGDNYSVLTEDGKTIDLGFSHTNALATKFVAFNENRVLGNDDGTITISGGELSDEQKTTIRDAFIAAGIDGNKVEFIKKQSLLFLNSESATNFPVDLLDDNVVKHLDSNVKRIIIKTKEDAKK